MIQISALNDSSSDESDTEPQYENTKEAQESNAFALYNKALGLQRTGHDQDAERVFTSLLNTQLLTNAQPPEDPEKPGSLVQPGLILKYSTYKNLGSIAFQRHDLKKAMEHYLEAVSLDSTDVTLWYKIGTVAVELYQLPLASLAFQQGLTCNQKHWPCLDRLCTVLYALNDYATCLYYICKALERDHSYTKGLALRDQIFSEQPSFKKDSYHMFRHCDDSIHNAKVKKEDANKFIQESLTLREKKRALQEKPKSPVLKFLSPLKNYTWKDVGEQLIALYDHVTDRMPQLSLGCVVDIPASLQLSNTKDEDCIMEVDPLPCTATPPVPQDPSSEIPARPLIPQDPSAATETPAAQNLSNEIPSMPSVPQDQSTETPAAQNPSTETPAIIPVPQNQSTETLGAQKPSNEIPGAQNPPTETPAAQEMQPPILSESGTVEDKSSLDPSGLAEVAEEKSSTEADAATTMPCLVQEQQEAAKTDGDQEVPTSFEAEKTQGDTASNQTADDHQQQGEAQQEDNQDVSASEHIAMDFDTPTRDTPDQSVPMDTEEADVSKQKKKRGPKRKRDRIEIEEPLGKRRSARVRNTTKKKEEIVSVNYAELLQRFLPSSLTDSDAEDDGISQDGLTNQEEAPTDNDAAMEDPQDNLVEQDSTEFIKTEEEEVRQFLKDHEDNSGVVDILHFYLVSLAKKYHFKWPPKLTEVYLKGFERLRKHCCFPEIFSSDASDEYRVGVGDMLLVYAELKLDQWTMARKKMAAQGTPKKSRSNASNCLADFPGDFFVDDMGYVEDLSRLPPFLGEQWRTFAIRANWMKSRFLVLEGKPEMSIDFFDECAYFLTSEKKDTDGTSIESLTVTLPNCVQENIITKDKIETQKKSLERCQSMEEVQCLNESEDYKRVIHLLLPTVLQPSLAATGKTMSETSVPERRAQLELLTKALVKLEDYSQCITCGSVSLGETWQELVTAKTNTAREEWTALLIKIMESLDKAMSQGVAVLASVERIRLVPLTATLINIIEHAMEGAEMESTQALTTVLPWIVLYRLIKLQEDKLTAMRISTGSPARSGSPVPLMSSSLMLLETAHEYLGRHSWCNNSEGALLKVYVSVLEKELRKVSEEDSHPFQEDLQMALEQCFYCLYAHPLRRSRARHLQDHRVEEVSLKWENAAFLFDHFKPKLVPEFDSYKANSMPNDLESLFLKIVKIIPEQQLQAENTLESVQAYMDGSSEKAPCLPEGVENNKPVISEVYYFLADFYFKNKEFGKAIKFYNLDICVCPNRLDSWAGDALARGGRLDLKINSCDYKTESSIYKSAVSALRCFKRALEIDETNLSLWIEYGSLAYTLHSHASRQLKQDVHPRLLDETIKLLREKRKEMLELAEHCFIKASECEGDGDGEEWLVEYMLGKIAEKQRTEPGVYLKHYLKAANHLYENEAKYPKKIAYHNPPDLSLEALEMYYRLHASILKLLKRKMGVEVNYASLNEFVMKAADTPFVKAKEKKNTATTDHSDMSSNEVDSDKSSSGHRSRLSSSGTPLSPAYMTPQDHDYVKKKKTKKRNFSLETLSTETASEGEFLSGDDTTSSSFGHSSGTAQLLKSLAEIKNKDPGDTGIPMETESSKDESPGRASMGDDAQKQSQLESQDAKMITDEQVRSEASTTDIPKDQKLGSEESTTDIPKDQKLGSEASRTDIPKDQKLRSEESTTDIPKMSSALVPVAVVKINPEATDSETAPETSQDEDQLESEISESEPEIIDLISDSDRESPGRARPSKLAKKKDNEKKKKEVASTKDKVDQKTSSTSEGVDSDDVTCIDLTVDSSDSEGVTSTPPRRALHEMPIKAKPPSKDVSRKVLADSDAKANAKDKADTKDKSKEVEPMEVNPKTDEKSSPTRTDDKASKPVAETGSSEPTKPAEEPKPESDRTRLINRCISALGLCLARFPQHYKSLYRLAQVHCLFETHKNLQWSRDLLLGTSASWQTEDHMPSPALFGEHSKTKNLFQGIWRIPITEIDRSGSFPWHMYRSVILLLEVLEHLQDHQMLLQVAIKLNKTPEQGKQYLRDSDRKYLSQQSYQLCLAVLQQQLSESTVSDDMERKRDVLMAANKVWQCVSSGKFNAEPGVPANILKEAYKAYKGSQVENDPSILEQAVRFCMYYKMVNKLPQTPTSQHADFSLPGRSPRGDTWCGSPVRGSQSETRFQFTSPSYDNRTNPEFSTSTPPQKTASSGTLFSDSGMSQDSVMRKTGVPGAIISRQYSSTSVDFQSAYKDSLERKVVKSRVGSPTSVPTHSKVTGGVFPKSPGHSSMTSPQHKISGGVSSSASSGGVKISAVTGKPIVKLRTLSSMGIMAKQTSEGQSQSKTNIGEQKEGSSHAKQISKVYPRISATSSVASNAPDGHKVGQYSSQSQPPMTTASADVVQKLREALGSKQVLKEKTFSSKVSLHKDHLKHGESSLGSHGNRPASLASQSSLISHVNRPTSTVSQSSLGSHGNKPTSTVSQSSLGSHGNKPTSTVSQSSLGSHGNRPASTVSQSSLGSHVNRPASTVSQSGLGSHVNRPAPQAAFTGSHSNPAGSFAGQRSPDQHKKDDASKDGDSKSNFMSSFLSFLGGSKK